MFEYFDEPQHENGITHRNSFWYYDRTFFLQNACENCSHFGRSKLLV